MDDKLFELAKHEDDSRRRERFFFFLAGVTVMIMLFLALNIRSNLIQAQTGNGYYNGSQIAYTPTGTNNGGCNMSSGGGCNMSGNGSTGTSGNNSSASLEQVQKQALVYYQQQTGDQGKVNVQVQDFGCHIQADIFKDGQKVKSYAFQGGQFNEV